MAFTVFESWSRDEAERQAAQIEAGRARDVAAIDVVRVPYFDAGLCEATR